MGQRGGSNGAGTRNEAFRDKEVTGRGWGRHGRTNLTTTEANKRRQGVALCAMMAEKDHSCTRLTLREARMRRTKLGFEERSYDANL